MKADEGEFLISVYIHRIDGEGIHMTPREIINSPSFHTHYKRAWYFLDKWWDKGWYEYGVTTDMGWLTKEGENQARLLLGKETL